MAYDVAIARVMTRDPVSVHPDDPLDMVASAMGTVEARHMPVVSDGRLVGIIALRDLLAAEPPALDRDHLDGWLHRIKARRIMSRHPIVVRPGVRVGEAASAMHRHDISCLPIVSEDDQLIGIVTVADLVRRAIHLLDVEGEALGVTPTVSHLMSPSVITIAPDASLGSAESLMRRHHIHHLVVVDEEGHVTGILSDHDVAASMPSSIQRRTRRELEGAIAAVQVADVMTRHPITVAPDRPAAEAAHLLLREKIGSAPVTWHDKLVGIVTERDFLSYVLSFDLD
ncbi:MAG TPA: CBS domain-containing protein [Kofleriaceae bacterium]|nr:CBS domain-containing protein [Kofleriaceae bacterium]